MSTMSWPLTNPSVASMAMVLTVFSPKCWATSSTSLSPPGIFASSALRMGGRAPVNWTSTTAPITETILPWDEACRAATCDTRRAVRAAADSIFTSNLRGMRPSVNKPFGAAAAAFRASLSRCVFSAAASSSPMNRPLHRRGYVPPFSGWLKSTRAARAWRGAWRNRPPGVFEGLLPGRGPLYCVFRFCALAFNILASRRPRQTRASITHLSAQISSLLLAGNTTKFA